MSYRPIYCGDRERIARKEMLFLIVCASMIFFTVINGNEFSAGLKFVLFPALFFFVISVILLWDIDLRRVVREYGAVILFGAFALVSSIISDVVPLSRNLSCIYMLFWCVAYICSTSVPLSAKAKGRLIRIYTRFVSVLCLILIINYAAGYSVNELGRVSITYFGIRKDSNYLTAFFVGAYSVSLYGGIYGRKRMRNMARAMLIFVALFLSGSRASFITSQLVTFIILMRVIFGRGPAARKIGMIFLVVLGISLSVYFFRTNMLFDRMFAPDSYSDNIRLKIWNYALKGFYRNPLFGSGVGAGTYYSQLHIEWVTHSGFVDLLAGQGIVGFVLLMCEFRKICMVKRGFRVFMLTTLIAFVMPLLFISGYENATFWVPMMLMKVLSNNCNKSEDFADLSA